METFFEATFDKDIHMDNIQSSWVQNAAEWIRIIKGEGIPSRRITNVAIQEVLKSYKLNRLLDLGCGEGWLTKVMNSLDVPTVGIDATPALIEQAKYNHPEGNYYVLSYQDIIGGADLKGGPFDAVVANFCLYEHEETLHLLQTLRDHLVSPAYMFIQTLHPFGLIKNKLIYQDQWMDDSWKGLNGNFTQPHQWYYRTFRGWQQLFHECQLSIQQIHEPTDPLNGNPLSVIFVLRK